MNAPNPLLLDPTHLAAARRAWEKALRDRNAKLRDALLLLLATLAANPSAAAYDAFVQEAERAATALNANPYWFRPYLFAAYKAGLFRSYGEVRPKPPQGDGNAKALFLMLVMGMPENAEGLSLLYARTAQALKGLGQYAAQRASAIVAQSIAEGWGQGKAAAAIAEALRLNLKRAALIAQTETTRAHAEGQLDALEALGVKKVGAVLEFVTVAGRGASEKAMKEMRVCPKCRGLAGRTFTIKQARGKIPVHPRCRCRWQAIRAKMPALRRAIVGV